MILDNIISHKRREVAERRELVSIKDLEQSEFFNRPTVSLIENLCRLDKVGIIAEIKRRSPSKGVINGDFEVEIVARDYETAGASALSILTDTEFFGGRNEDLTVAARTIDCPILRKDFVVDEFQIVEARAIGADAILLIAAVLTAKEIAQFAAFAQSLQLETILEIHELAELPTDLANISVLGINNRDLRSFSVDVNRSFEIASRLPDSIVKISESGLDDARTIVNLKRAGFDGFLIGEAFMRTREPGAACSALIAEIKDLLENETTEN